MSVRIKKKWQVLRSIESADGNYCVDIFVREDGTFGFEEFRRDLDDGGGWVSTSYYSSKEIDSQKQTIADARRLVLWLDE